MRSLKKKKKVKLLLFGLLGLLGLLGVLGGVWIIKNRVNNSKANSSLVSPVGEGESLEILLKSSGEEIVGKIDDEGDYLVATISSGTTIYLNKVLNHEKILASLQLIFKNIRIEGRWPLIIDLRFSRPILRY